MTIPTYTDTIAARIVAAIKRDLTGRRGLRQEWEAVDADIQQEIVERWTELAKRELAVPNPDIVAVGGSIQPYVFPVKPLVWRAEPHDLWARWTALHCGRAVHVIHRSAVGCPYLLVQHASNAVEHPTLEAAQAAAQTEWDGFIRAALEGGSS